MAKENTKFAGFGHVGFPERGMMVGLYGRILLELQKENNHKNRNSLQTGIICKEFVFIPAWNITLSAQTRPRELISIPRYAASQRCLVRVISHRFLL